MFENFLTAIAAAFSSTSKKAHVGNHQPSKSSNYTKKGPGRVHKQGTGSPARRRERKLRSCSR